MPQSTTLSLSQNIWPRWALRQFLSLPTVQTLLPVTFAYSLSSRVVAMRQMKEAVTKVIDTLTQEDFHGALQRLLERYNKCIAAGGDYLEGDKSFMCVLFIKVPITKNNRNLLNDPRMFTYIMWEYIYIYILYIYIYTLIYPYIYTLIYAYIYIYIYIIMNWGIDVLS